MIEARAGAVIFGRRLGDDARGQRLVAFVVAPLGDIIVLHAIDARRANSLFRQRADVGDVDRGEGRRELDHHALAVLRSITSRSSAGIARQRRPARRRRRRSAWRIWVGRGGEQGERSGGQHQAHRHPFVRCEAAHMYLPPSCCSARASWAANSPSPPSGSAAA